MGREPEEHEVGVDLAVEHGFEVEFEVGLAGQGLVVAEDAEAQAVGDDGPEVALAAVEEFLDQPVGIGGGGAAHACGAPVQVDAATDEMDGGNAEEAVDGVGTPVEFGPGTGGEQAEAEFTEQGQGPFVVG
ncbi:MAG: hypothetical protein BWX80_02224 [Candidatus Hydrogenedentes bacterium ADurb.Bin101]|nr:MAG: hypothetical protein BWX80_02224 [Candidatus Hydrogenedentes bacterium ADurb.Bin101]